MIVITFFVVVVAVDIEMIVGLFVCLFLGQVVIILIVIVTVIIILTAVDVLGLSIILCYRLFFLSFSIPVSFCEFFRNLYFSLVVVIVVVVFRK